MFTLKKIDPLSVAKVYAILFLIVGIVENAIILSAAAMHLGSAGVLSHIAGIPAFFILAFVVLVLMFILFGFLVGLVGSWLYNVIAGWVGGVKIDLKGDKLRAVDPMSYGKVVAVFGLIFGVAIGLVLAAFGGTILNYLGVSNVSGSAFSAALLIITVIIGILGSFLLGIFSMIVYNFLARHIGPVILHFRGRELWRIGALSYAKINGVAGLIIGFIDGVASMSAFGFLTSIILVPIGAFLIAGAVALVYNWLARRIGGYRITLHEYRHTGHRSA